MKCVWEEAEIVAKENRVFELVSCSSGFLQVDCEFRIGIAPRTLCDASRHSECTAPEMKDKSEILTRWEIFGSGIDPKDQAMGFLPDVQLMKVLHGSPVPKCNFLSCQL